MQPYCRDVQYGLPLHVEDTLQQVLLKSIRHAYYAQCSACVFPIQNSASLGSSSSFGMETFHPFPVPSCINEAVQLSSSD